MTSFAKRSDSASHPLFVGIGRADIHLWLIKFDEISNCVADICLRLLSADERARLSRLLSRDHKEQYLIAHAGLRLLLSKYFPPIKPVNWAFSFGAFGRPEVTGGAPGLSFNISHTNGYVALAFARDCRLGVDVEARISEIDLELADSVCTPAELRDLRGVPSSLQTARFTRLWTLKEAYLKALGTGFALSAKAISYRFSPTGELMHAIKAPEAEKRNSWHFCYADVSNNCSLAIAWTSHQGPENRSVKQFRLSPSDLFMPTQRDDPFRCLQVGETGAIAAVPVHDACKQDLLSDQDRPTTGPIDDSSTTFHQKSLRTIAAGDRCRRR